jgi:MATE family multidrug resistance protein
MGKSKLPLLSYMITSFLHVLWSYLFIEVLQWQEIGIAMATNVSYILNLIVLSILCYFALDEKEAFFIDIREGCKDLIPYMRIAIPSCLLFCLKNWAIQGLSLISAELGTNSNDA